MGFSEFIRSKSIKEYMDAKHDDAKMKELRERKLTQGLKESVESSIVSSAKKQEDNKLKKAVKKELKDAIICPRCQSTDVQFMQTDKKGFSTGKAIGGAVLTGGVGALAGFAGKKGKRQWFCKNCNHVFETKK